MHFDEVVLTEFYARGPEIITAGEKEEEKK